MPPMLYKICLFLENLAKSRGRSESSSNPARRLHPPFPDPTPTHKVSFSHKPLCQSPQEQLPVGGITSAYRQKRSGKGSKPQIPRVFQPTITSPKAQRQVEANTGPKQTKPFPQDRKVQNGDTGNHQNIPPAGGVGHLSRFQRCQLPHTNTGTIQEIPKISYPGPDLSVQGTALWSVHSAHGVHCTSEGGETDLDDWLVRARSYQACLQHTQSLVKICQDLGWLVNLEKSKLEPKQVFDFVGYQFDLRSGRVRRPRTGGKAFRTRYKHFCHYRPVRQFMSLIGLLTATEKQVHLGRLHMRPIQWHLKNNWRVPESLEKIIPLPRTLHPHLQWWLNEDNVLQSQPLHPVKHALQIFTEASKEEGGSLKRVHCKRILVCAGKQAAHKLSGTQSSSSSLKRVPRSLCRQNSSGSNRQYYSGSLHKQGRRHEVGPPLCPSVENLDLVFPATSNSESPTHPRPVKCHSRQTIQAGSDHPNRVVPPSGGFSTNLQLMAPASNRSVCYEIQPQITSVCLSSTGLPGCSSGCTHSAMGGSECICLPTDRHIGQSGGETTGLPVQETHSDCPGVAQHALVLGLGDHVQSGPSQPAQSADTALQSDPSQKSDKSKSPCLAPRATKIKEQGFSEAVAARIEAVYDQSMRQSGPFLQSGASLIRWTSGHHL